MDRPQTQSATHVSRRPRSMTDASWDPFHLFVAARDFARKTGGASHHRIVHRHKLSFRFTVAFDFLPR